MKDSIITIIIRSADFISYSTNTFLVTDTLTCVRSRTHKMINIALLNRMRLFLIGLRINNRESSFFFINFIVPCHATLLVLLLSVSASAQEVKDPDNIGYVPCPQGEMKKVNRDNPYHGGHVRCEDFNHFFELLESGQIEKAGKLLIKPMKPMKPDRTKKLKPFKFRHTPWPGEKVIISDTEKV